MPGLAPRRILIIRLSAIGDVILASGLIRVLKVAWPEAEIHWLTEELNADLLRRNDLLAKVRILPRRLWARLRKEKKYLALFGELRAFRRELRAADFDLVLDVQGLMKSGLIAWLTAAPLRIGLGSKEGSALFMHRVVSRAVQSHLPGKEYRALCRALGLDDTAYALEVPVAGEDMARAREILAAHGIAGDYIVFCPFTTRPQKHWFDARWIELGERLGRQTGLPIAMLGGPGDAAHARAIAEHDAAGIVDLTGRTSLLEAAAVIRQARLLVGVDTGLTHLGLAEGTPTLGLFGSTRPYLDPRAANARVLYEPMDCSPCRRHPTCDGRFDCMRRHDVDAVLAAATALFEGVA